MFSIKGRDFSTKDFHKASNVQKGLSGADFRVLVLLSNQYAYNADLSTF